MDEKQCDALIYKRDCYRVSRGRNGGFTMHYTRDQCSRRATDGDLCMQHAKVDKARFLLRWSRR